MRNATIRVSCWLVGLALMLTAGLAEAQQRDPDKAKIHDTRAKAARDMKQWNTAAAEWKKAHKLDPLAKYLFNIGLASDLAGKKQQALDAFRGYLAAEPNGQFAVTAQAKVQELVVALKKAKDEAAAAKVATHLRAAKAHRASGKHDGSAYEYGEAYKLTQNSDYLFEVAESYRLMADKKRAIAAYKSYLKAAAAGKFAISARRHIETLEAPEEDTNKGDPDVTTEPTVTKIGKKKKKNKWIWIAAGAAAIVAGVAADTIPAAGENGKFDATDVLPLGLYGAGLTAVFVGVF